MGICHLLQKAGVNFMGVEDASPNNPDKSHDEKLWINMQTFRKTRLPVSTNA